MTIIRVGLLLGCFLLFVSAHANAANDAPYGDTLTGDWGGLRTDLADKGFEFEMEYKGDFWNVGSGGLKTGSNYLDNLDIRFTLDGEKAFGVAGNTFFVSFLNNFGGKPNTRLGGIDGISNIETGTNTFKLYEAFVEQNLMQDKLSVLFGVHDLNSEFYVTDISGNFIKPSMQLGPEIAGTGLNGPNVFPNTGLAARIRYNPTDSSYVMAAAFDGVPGDPDHPHGTHVGLESDDGALLIAEIGLAPPVEGRDDAPNKLAAGVWSYTEQVNDLVGADHSRTKGFYLLGSGQFFDDDAGRTLTAFVHTGWADGETTPIAWSLQLGLVANGWVPFRPDSEIGVGFTDSRNSDDAITAAGGSGALERSEYSFDAYYRDNLGHGIFLQPEFQYVWNPGTDPAVDNAPIYGLRLDVSF